MKLTILFIAYVFALTSFRVEESSAGVSPCVIAGTTVAAVGTVLGGLCAASFWIPFVNIALCGGAVASSAASVMSGVTLVAGSATAANVIGVTSAAMVAGGTGASLLPCRRKRAASFAGEEPLLLNRFTQLDTNADGFLSMQDIDLSFDGENPQASKQKPTADMNTFLFFPKWLDVLDSDKDSKISVQEWTSGFQWNSTDDSLVVNLFSIADVNGDGEISLTELVEVELPMGGGLSKSLRNSQLSMSRLDKDGDSLVSLAELKMALKAMLLTSGSIGSGQEEFQFK